MKLWTQSQPAAWLYFVLGRDQLLEYGVELKPAGRPCGPPTPSFHQSSICPHDTCRRGKPVGKSTGGGYGTQAASIHHDLAAPEVSVQNYYTSACAAWICLKVGQFSPLACHDTIRLA